MAMANLECSFITLLLLLPLQAYLQLPRFSAQQLANTTWALARLNVVPDAPWTQQLLGACTARLRCMGQGGRGRVMYKLQGSLD